MIEPALDLVSASYLIVIIIGIYHIKEEKGVSTKAFISCCWICFTGLIIDAMSYIIPEWVHNEFILSIVIYLAYIWFDILMVAYGYYLIVLIEKKTGKFSRKMLWITVGLCALYFVFLTVGAFTGRIFAVENGQLLLGPWNNYVSELPTAILLVYIYYLFKNNEVLGFGDLIVLSVYFILQVPVAVLWFFDITVISGYVGFALSLTVIFVMIQFRIIAESNMKAEVFNTLSVRDVLTGLNNRRAYEKCLSGISSEADVCAVFCDVNSLKTVNDTMGHEEGDKLIKKMAGVLRAVFAEEEIFRISGDEFVVILQNKEEDAVSEKITALKQVILENDKIASMGYGTGKGSDILGVIDDAEQMMYLEKEDYYIETGKDRRS